MAAPLLPAPATDNQSYIDYLNDIGNDHYRDLPTGYTDIMEVFAVGLNNQNAITPAEVQNLVLSAEGAMPLLLLHDGFIHCYLQPSLFRRRIGLPATPWDNQMFVTKGNLHRNQPITANWMTEYFHQLNGQVLAPTVDTIHAAFAADPLQLSFGPYGPGDQGTELIRARRTCFCPAPYAALILDAPVTPRTAFTLIHAQLVIDNKVQECEALVRFLQVALVATANNGPSPLQLGVTPTAPLGDGNLINHRTSILHRDFPLLDSNLPRIQQNQIATRLGELVEDNRVHRREEKVIRDASRIKDPIDLVGATGVAKLCRYLRVPDQSMLQPIYGRLASSSRHNRLAELQWAVDAERSRLGYHRLSFIITPSLLNMVVSVRWIMDHHDNITSGFQPYLFGDTTPEESRSMSSLYQLVTSGQAAPTLEDAAALVAPSKPILPSHLFQTREMLQRMQIMFHITLGVNHQFSNNLTQFLRDFVDRESSLFWYIPTSVGYRLCMPLLVIHWIMLRTDHWFRSQAVSDVAIPAPNLGELFTDIELGKHWEPALPPSLLVNFQRPTRPNPPPSQVPPPSSQQGGGEPSGHPGGNPLPNRMVQNENYKTELFGTFKEMQVNHAALRNRITVRPPASPHSVSGGEMCLSFHIKGMCNARCGRADDHKSHTDAQDQLLVDWCNVHYKNE
jgi:hypothetical protein